LNVSFSIIINKRKKEKKKRNWQVPELNPGMIVRKPGVLPLGQAGHT
jgi:hypothetical protein